MYISDLQSNYLNKTLVNKEWLFHCSWECERNYSDPMLAELTKKNETLKQLAENSQGCFKEQPGQLSFNTGSFSGATTTMLPFTSYVLTVEVSKDTRKETYTQDFKVAAMDPPVLSIRYVCSKMLDLTS